MDLRAFLLPRDTNKVEPNNLNKPIFTTRRMIHPPFNVLRSYSSIAMRIVTSKTNDFLSVVANKIESSALVRSYFKLLGVPDDIDAVNENRDEW